MRHLTNIRRSPRTLLAMLAVGALCAAYCNQASAATASWIAGTANWDAAGSWSGGGGTNARPNANDDALINNGGTAQITAALGNPNIRTLTVGQTNLNSGNVMHAVGDLTLTAGDAVLGRDTGSSGTYTLNSGSLNGTSSAGDFDVGRNGIGTFTQNGGDVAFFKNIRVGRSTGGMGTYTLNDGTLKVTETSSVNFRLFIGESGQGVFNQTGGDVEVNWLTMAGNSSATAEYNMSGGNLTVAGNNRSFELGGNGTTEFNLSGGNVKYNGNQFFNIGQNNGQTDFNITGKDATVAVTNLRLNNGSNDTLRYTLNNSGVTPITYTGNVQEFDGNLDVDLLGGAALLSSTSHNLISGTNNIQNGGDNSVFSEVLWNRAYSTNAANTNKIDVVLDPADQKGTFALGSETGPFTAANAGWVEINGLTPGSPFDLQLDVTTTSLMDLIDFLNDNGHTAAASDAGDPFDLMLTFDPTLATEFFAWDFSDFDTLAGNTAPTTVQNVSTVVAGVPEPASVAIWMLLGLGLISFGYLQRRRKLTVAG